MKRIYFLLLVAVAGLSSCGGSKWKKAEDGMEYKVIASGSGATMKPGDFIEFHLSSVWNNGKKDSMLMDSREQGLVNIVQFDTLNIPPAYFKIFKELRKGDSLTSKMPTDSIFKKQPGAMPPFMKQGQTLYTNIKITNIFKSKEDAELARTMSMQQAQQNASRKAKAQAETDEKLLTDYFSSKGIKPMKVTGGSYVQILQPGTGPNVDTTVVVSINYTGSLMNGHVFDSNTDPSKGHIEPLKINMTNNPMLGSGVIPGMTEALKLLNKGAKARLFIPSGQAYGPQAGGADMPANSNLFFDVEVLDIMNKTAAMADAEKMQRQMQELQKRYTDSMNKLKPQTANP